MKLYVTILFLLLLEMPFEELLTCSSELSSCSDLAALDCNSLCLCRAFSVPHVSTSIPYLLCLSIFLPQVLFFFFSARYCVTYALLLAFCRYTVYYEMQMDALYRVRLFVRFSSFSLYFDVLMDLLTLGNFYFQWTQWVLKNETVLKTASHWRLFENG